MKTEILHKVCGVMGITALLLADFSFGESLWPHLRQHVTSIVAPPETPGPCPCGDVDGDGIQDFLFLPSSGVPGEPLFRIVYGRSEAGRILVGEDPDGETRIAADQWAFEIPQWWHFGAADVNADGRADLIIPLPSWIGEDLSERRSALVVLFGGRHLRGATFLLEEVPSQEFPGFRILAPGIIPYLFWSSALPTFCVAQVGDVNGDGISDTAVCSGFSTYQIRLLQLAPTVERAGMIVLFGGRSWEENTTTEDLLEEGLCYLMSENFTTA